MTDVLQTAALFLLSVLNAGLIAAVLADGHRIAHLERQVDSLERSSLGLAKGGLADNATPLIDEAEWLPPTMKHRDIKS